MRHLRGVGEKALNAGFTDLSAKDLQLWPNFGDEGSKIKIKNDLQALYSLFLEGYGSSDPFTLKDMIAISELEWFERVWIVQELSVSTAYEFMCGKTTVPGDHFSVAVTFSARWVASEARRKFQTIESAQASSLAYRWEAGKRASVSPRAMMTLWTRKKWQHDHPNLKQQLCRVFVLATAEAGYLGAMNDMHNARPFLSENAVSENTLGGLVGLCPRESKSGDEIWIPLDAHVPYILREAGDGCLK